MSTSQQTYGQVDWNSDAFNGDRKATNSKDLFLRLNEGSNELRLITQPYQYLVHKVKKDLNNPKDFGQKVLCSAVHGSCPVCATGDKAKPRWLLGVIDRKTGVYKILDISFAVFSQIRKYAKNQQRFGDPTKYDINIEVDKNGGATGYYLVQPLNKEPLSASDQVIKDAADLEDLKRRVSPPTADVVQKRIDRIMGTENAVLPSNGKEPVAVKVVAPVSMSDDEAELEAAFPNYEETPQAANA